MMDQEKENKIDISIIVPFWNVEKYFEDCLISLKNQKSENLEFLLIDDCSPDGSLQIAEKYAQIDKRFKIIKNHKNLGVGGARNIGIGHARGQYVWFVDSDDTIQSDACADLFEHAKTQDLDILYFNYERDFSEGFRADEQKYIKGVLPGHEEINDCSLAVSGFVYLHLFHSYTSSGKIWSLNFIKKNNCLFEERTHFEDNVHALWMLNARRIGYCDKYCYVHRIRGESITTKNRIYSDYIHHIRISESLNQYSNNIDLTKFTHKSIVLTKHLQMVVFNKWLIKCYRNANPSYRKIIVQECCQALLRATSEFNENVINDSCSFFKYRYGILDLRKALALRSINNLENSLRNIFDESDRFSIKKIIRYLKPYGMMEG